MQIVGIAIMVMMASFWWNHTTKTQASKNRPPGVCQVFDYRYAPENKAMCDAWDKAHPDS